MRKNLIASLCSMVLVLAAAVQVHGIIDIQGLPVEKTPTILRGFDTAMKDYLKEYDKTPANNGEPADLRYFVLRLNGDQAVAGVKEIALAQSQMYASEDALNRILGEFRNLQAQMKDRGFEPSQNSNWALPRKLRITYSDRFEVGPTPYPHPINKRPVEHYSHSFSFEMKLSYQPKGRALQPHDDYPVVSIEGFLFLRCKKPFAECVVYSAAFGKAGISWERIPGPRGGNSSAGGTRPDKVWDRPILEEDVKP